MEANSEGEKKKPPEEVEQRSKRKMKSASQLEILEKTYAVETYPSEAVRAELSVQLGLSDRQLQMWFCHRRLKDRKPTPVKRPRKDSPEAVGGGIGEEMVVVGEAGNDHGLRSGSVLDLRGVVSWSGVAVPRISSDMQAFNRYHEPPESMAELRAIAFVEAQLGESLRDDGPILGMEFDPLPPDAFGAHIGGTTMRQHKQSGRSFEPKVYERPDVKVIKGSARSLHEYQFLPEQPTVRTETYERAVPSYQYGSPAEVSNVRSSLLTAGNPLTHGNDQVSAGYGFPGQIPSLNFLSQQGMQSRLLPSASGEYDDIPQKNSLTSTGMDAHFVTHPITTQDNPFISYDRRVTNDEDVARMERKRKNEEARISREVEAHEKRIRKELERQDIMRRKREEQIKKEIERQDRERRKEEERLLREKQREEERYQREQRRELERREKFVQKEIIRAEKMRQKEELRREKEAARLKAANEKAIARRVAKESMELIEDERLELMELAASSKGLPSVLSLDFETLHNLDVFGDMLTVFPPKSAKLKRPFSVQPWSDSEENVGNLLMVWRFLITFADILGLWPFTLDEFVQAFHDYDPRLLGEIHVALLRSIIKDIEDVARTPATGLGANQNSAASPGGGHPQIVEGAYAWGFNIRSWQRHLNTLTWPEILRQFSLSSGFGPQLKKGTIEQRYLRDDNESNDGEDVISNLRNGAAVENAVAIMQERGFSNPRRSRHRLTPGTVKFAAFHVLSCEGSKGLTILEVAEKIQKSGLRDLTTSKTPEASIAAALSRDSKLFERTAPSRYCVRAAYRKDPAVAEAILSAAQERIRIFKSGFIDREDADDVERDEDSESDVAEDPEVDYVGGELTPKKEARNSQEVNDFDAKTPFRNDENYQFLETLQGGLKSVSDALAFMHSDSLHKVKHVDASGILSNAANLDQEYMDIDESNPGEPWVQGLMEGEYADLSVEERLNGLVSLIGVAIEGNSIRTVLEERLEAATALKKQMWAEAQLDKRRLKEEYVLKMRYSAYMGNKTEPTISSGEGRQSPCVAVEDKSNGDPSIQQERSSDPHSDQTCVNNFFSEGNLQMQDYSAGPDNLPYQQPGYVAEISRSQLKSYIGHMAEEMSVYRSLPLGQDRRRNRYWQFITSRSRNDPGCGRIFIELHDGRWRLIDTEEDFDILLASLDVRGVKESHLHTMLQKIEISFKETVKRNVPCSDMERQSGVAIKSETLEMDLGPHSNIGTDSACSTVCSVDSEISETSTSFAIELGRNETERIDALERYQGFEKWMWKECFTSSILCAVKFGKKQRVQLLGVCDHCHEIFFFEDHHCPSCHNTYLMSERNFSFSEHVAQCEEKWRGSVSSPLRIRLLKVQLALIEVSIPPEALKTFWTDSYRKFWVLKLLSASEAEDLLQILTLLESALKRDYLSSNFETTSELLGLADQSGYAADNTPSTKTIYVIPWIPQTIAAVGLRLMEFDASIYYMLHQKVDDNRANDFITLPSKYTAVKKGRQYETAETQNQAECLQAANWVDTGIVYASTGRGRGGRGRRPGLTRGGRSQRRVTGSRSESDRTAVNGESLRQVFEWKGKPRQRGGRRRGRRSIRSRQKPVKKVVEFGNSNAPKQIIFKKPAGGLIRGGWNGVETMKLRMGSAENASSSERSEYDDDNGQATGDEYYDYASGLIGKSGNLLEMSDYNIDDEEEEIDDDDDEEERGDGVEDKQGDLDVDVYINDDSEEEGIGDRDQNGDPNVVTGSTSSDFSE
ncbi:Homeobox domain-containing protein/DDT domain-containing protein [Cephalotus follicularis]|uniref:Homeobox domain-containing protein/DDT domain-containing protein n=1 Tax=Cephalotus follicularis TaxID=3775 RepID=A0A1Q3C1K9_CEPFO|nr:Homeobox domain-containing protein/DDT domain-containing protein [Cephalotus follicularis]